jgi:hypothetical protein
MMMPNKNTILSIAYAPPINYFSNLAKESIALIEAHENYQKQSFRNRCNILSSAGIQTLIIPVKHGTTLNIRDIEIEYKDFWQKKHWKSLITCYNSSPYFTFYRDDFDSLYNQNIKFLFDWNLAILEIFNRHFKIPMPSLTNKWQLDYSDAIDLREKIHPKRILQEAKRKHETTFHVNDTERAHLSAFDLLFNTGPDSILYI